jgi:hypothetical protein
VRAKKIQKKGLVNGFSIEEYCAKYPDVGLSRINPEEHFDKIGSRLGRNLHINNPKISVIISIYKK